MDLMKKRINNKNINKRKPKSPRFFPSTAIYICACYRAKGEAPILETDRAETNKEIKKGDVTYSWRGRFGSVVLTEKNKKQTDRMRRTVLGFDNSGKVTEKEGEQRFQSGYFFTESGLNF